MVEGVTPNRAATSAVVSRRSGLSAGNTVQVCPHVVCVHVVAVMVVGARVGVVVSLGCEVGLKCAPDGTRQALGDGHSNGVGQFVGDGVHGSPLFDARSFPALPILQAQTVSASLSGIEVLECVEVDQLASAALAVDLAGHPPDLAFALAKEGRGVLYGDPEGTGAVLQGDRDQP